MDAACRVKSDRDTVAALDNFEEEFGLLFSLVARTNA
jgi:hypothetical protein